MRAPRFCAGVTAAFSAYAIVERHGAAAHVVDLFGYRNAIGDLLDLLLPALRDEGAASASLAFLGDPGTRRLLTARGFSPREQGPVLLFDAESDDVAAELARPERWYLTDADDDV